MIYFISDLHLASDTLGVSRIFMDFIARLNAPDDRLIILGDFFEAWPGDDCLDDPCHLFERETVKALQELTKAGVLTALIHGNRDFLLGETFSLRSGVKLLPDPFLLEAQSGRFILSHGDALCLEDKQYQAFRAMVRQEAWQSAFLHKPLQERQAFAHALREQSEHSRQQKTKAYAEADLNPDAVNEIIRKNGYTTFIHGHMHHPKVCTHLVDGHSVERWVLSSWQDGQGNCLVWDGQRLYREELY